MGADGFSQRRLKYGQIRVWHKGLTHVRLPPAESAESQKASRPQRTTLVEHSCASQYGRPPCQTNTRNSGWQKMRLKDGVNDPGLSAG